MTRQLGAAIDPSFRASASLAALTLALLVGLSPAHAQDADTGPTSSEAAVEAEAAAVPAEAQADDEGPIVVTGSRIARSGFTTPTPVTVLGQEQIGRQGASNVSQVLNEIPAFRPQSTPAYAPARAPGIGAPNDHSSRSGS